MEMHDPSFNQALRNKPDLWRRFRKERFLMARDTATIAISTLVTIVAEVGNFVADNPLSLKVPFFFLGLIPLIPAVLFYFNRRERKKTNIPMIIQGQDPYYYPPTEEDRYS